jgi:hypothetical protein
LPIPEDAPLTIARLPEMSYVATAEPYATAHGTCPATTLLDMSSRAGP